MRFILPLILYCFCSVTVFAKEGVRIGPEPAWLYTNSPDLRKTPDNRDIRDGYYFNLFDEQTNIPAHTNYTHFIKQIVNESGVQNESEVSVSFSPEYQELVMHKIAIIRNNQVINQLIPGHIKVVQEETEAEDFQYNGLKRAFVILKDVRKGDRIEVAYSLIGSNPVFNNKFSDKIYLTQSTAICNYYKTLITTAVRPLFMRPANNAPLPAEQHKGDALIYQWSNPSLQTWEAQPHVPGWFNSYPVVAVSEYPDWQSVVGWGMGLMHQYQYPLPQGLQDKITIWKKEAGSDNDELANKAIRFVQDDVRYLGLEIGPGTHQPRSPADVFTHRFGDCKDKALLLAVILQSVHIPAYVALVNTSTREKLADEMPSPDEFNHAIVAIERSDNQYVFIDATIPAQRGSLVNHYIPAYGYALILKKDEKQLRHVDLGSPNNLTVTEWLDARYNDSCRFIVNTTYAGGLADNIRNQFAENSIRDLEQSYEKYYATLFDGIRLEKPPVMKDNPDPLYDKVEVTENYLIPALWTTNEKGKKFFNVTAKILTDYLLSPSSMKDNTPMSLQYPLTVNYTLKIRMPESWPFSVKPLHIKNDSYQFDFVPVSSDNLLELRYFFKTFKDHIPAAEMAQYKADYKSIADKFYFELYKNGAGGNSPDGGTADKHLNWWSVGIAVLFVLLFVGLFKYLNSRSEETLYRAGTGYPLGGWVVVFGITLVLRFIVQFVALFVTNNYFDYASWHLLGELGTGLQFLLLFELVASLFSLCSLAALLYWYLKRRDIFPKMFIWYAGTFVSIEFTLITAYHTVHLPEAFANSPASMTTQLIRSIFYTGIWVTYLLRSERVKATFLEPYRPEEPMEEEPVHPDGASELSTPGMQDVNG